MIYYYFETDLNSTLERNHHREGKANILEVDVRVPYKKLEVPSINEGFDAIFNVKIIGNGEFSITMLYK